MNLYEINGDSLSKHFGIREIPEEFIIVAKHLVMGLTQEQIADTMGCGVEVIHEVEADELFKQVKAFIGGVYSEQQASQSAGWDAIETIAISGLVKRLALEKDKEFLLKAAAVANRAARRTAPPQNLLDPSRSGKSTITLTQRLVQKINQAGSRETMAERTLSIRDGSMSNPTFSEVDSLLSVSNRPYLPQSIEIRTHQGEVSQDELVNDLLGRIKDRP